MGADIGDAAVSGDEGRNQILRIGDRALIHPVQAIVEGQLRSDFPGSPAEERTLRGDCKCAAGRRRRCWRARSRRGQSKEIRERVERCLRWRELPKPQVSVGSAVANGPCVPSKVNVPGAFGIIKHVQARIAVITAETELVGAHRVSEGLIDVAGGVDASERRR